MNSKSFVDHFVWHHQYFEKIATKKLTILRCPRTFDPRFMYIGPSSGQPLLDLDLPFKWILRFEVVWFMMSGVRMLHISNITLDPRLPFPDSVGGIFPGPATTLKVYQGIEWFSQLAGLQWMTFLSMLIRGITAGDWLIILLSCYITLFWLRVKFDKFPSCECEDSPKWWLNS